MWIAGRLREGEAECSGMPDGMPGSGQVSVQQAAWIPALSSISALQGGACSSAAASASAACWKKL